MTRGVLDRRIARLEATQLPVGRQRIVWVDEGKPMPEAKPGERLTIIRWTWETDPGGPSAATSGEKPEEAVESRRQCSIGVGIALTDYV